MQQSSQLIQSNKISKPLSKDDSERLARSQIDRKEGYVEKPKKSTNTAALNGQSVLSKDTTPRPIKEEINQLAKAWCELLVGQMQENTINRN